MTNPVYDATISDWGSNYDVAEGPNHMIDETVTGGAFASVRNKAWHNLGTVWKPEEHDGRLPDSRELLREAHCDFPIFSAPIIAQIERRDQFGHLLDIEVVEDAKKVNILRNHPETGKAHILGQMSPTYQLWTPEQVLCGFGDAILASGSPTASTCGALDEGRRVFMGFELPNDVLVGGLTDERLKIWMVVETSFDGSAITSATLTTIRPVCANTIRAGVKKAISRFTIRRTANAKLDAVQARTALDLVLPFVAETKANADAMIGTRLTNQQFADIVTSEWGPGESPSKKAGDIWDEKLGTLFGLFTQSDTQANARNTAWAGFQAVTEYADWKMGVRGLKGADAETLATAQFKRSMFGGGADFDKIKKNAARVFGELAGIGA
jgi:phage/plasmid-like protein (TIGR03299 family)